MSSQPSPQTTSQVDEAIAEFRAFQARPVVPEPEIRVNGVAIPAEAIRLEAQNHPAETPAAAFEEAARALVVRELLLQQARELQLDVAPSRDENGRQETEEDSLIGALLACEVATPQADAESCRRYYRNNSRKFRSADLYEARHILLAADPKDQAARDAARSLGERLIAALAADPSRFAELAAAHSACPSREQGGNLGQLTQGQTVPEFETFLFNLEDGQLCPVPVPTRFGFHVIRLERKLPGRQLDFELVRPRIAEYLEATSWSRAVTQYIGLLVEAAEIEGIDFAATS